MRIGVISLFPQVIESIANFGVVGRAIDNRLASLLVKDPRDFTTDTHRTVDDRPYGGGPGMVMKAEPLKAAIDAVKAELGAETPVIHLSPAGKPFDQRAALRLAALPAFVLVSSRYEGVDERLVEDSVDEEWSIGDFVLSGGEVAAMAVIDAVVRLLPGALGDADSAEQDSFMRGLLDHPHYTRPDTLLGREVPEVLTSGDHERIARWRHKQALGRTLERRPELLEQLELSEEQRELLDEYRQETGLQADTTPGVSLQVENDEQTD